MVNRFVIEPLDRKEHDRAAFNCDRPELNEYIQKQARQDQERGAAVVFVLREPGSKTIVGYFTLNASSVEHQGLPAETAHKLPRYPTLPAALIGRLAVDKNYQRQGIGGYLLVSALKKALHLSKTEMGICVVIVDAKDDTARSFYEAFGFLRLPEDEYRLFMPMQDIAANFS